MKFYQAYDAQSHAYKLIYTVDTVLRLPGPDYERYNQ